LDTKTLFDIPRLGNVKNVISLASVIIIDGQNDIGLRMGTPGLVIKKSYDNSGGKVQVMFPFPPTQGVSPNYVAVGKRRYLALLDECFLHKHRFITVPGFDSNKIKKINEYVNEQNALSLNIERTARITGTVGQATGKVMSHFVDKLVDIIRNYKYHSLQYIFVNDGYKAFETDDVGYIITFMSLHDCISIFNPKRVDGMYMLINMYEKSKSRVSGMMSSIMRVGIVLSNYEDNIFVVDGVHILGRQSLVNKAITRLKKIIDVNMHIKTKKKKKKSGTKYDNSGATLSYTSSDRYRAFGTSSTTNYHYNTISTS